MYSGVVGFSWGYKSVTRFVLYFVYERGCLACVGITRITNSSQLIEILKVTTASTGFVSLFLFWHKYDHFDMRTVFLRKYSSFLHKNIRNIKSHFVFSLRATGNLPSTCWECSGCYQTGHFSRYDRVLLQTKELDFRILSYLCSVFRTWDGCYLIFFARK